MFSKFFIDRPIFALVISIVIILLGILAMPILPIEKTPDITPPTVMVNAFYPGADAETIAKTVAIPLEEKINGVEDMLYMSSKSSDDGSMTITVTFEVGTDMIDIRDILGADVDEADFASYLSVDTIESGGVTSTVLTIDSDGKGNFSGGAEQVITIEGVDIMDGAIDVNTALQSIIDSSKPITD